MKIEVIAFPFALVDDQGMEDPAFESHLRQLSETPFGKRVGGEICAGLCGFAVEREVPEGETIFAEGDEPAGIYVVLEGQVKLIRSSGDLREHIVHLAEKQAVFGEASLFLGSHPVSGVTLQPTTLLLFPRVPFLEFMGHEPELQAYILDIMAQWLKQLIEKIDELTLCDGAQRLARYLVGLHEKSPYADYVTAAHVDLPTRKRDLATMLNMNQPSLSRILRQLQDQEMIEVKGRRVVLKDLDALRGLARLPIFRHVQREFG